MQAPGEQANERPWYVISLRPIGGHGGVRRAAREAGATVFACSPLRLEARVDAGLDLALRCPRVIFTSPAAVRLCMLQRAGFRPQPGQVLVAVGAGTARALARAGLGPAQAPTRMDSEGLLSLPALADVSGSAVGLVTAPGGRGVIAPALAQRGARVTRADVYQRSPVTLAQARIRALSELPAPRVLLASSGEALEAFIRQLPEDLRRRTLAEPVVVPSARLDEIAQASGFAHRHRATSARPSDMVDAAAHAVGQGFG